MRHVSLKRAAAIALSAGLLTFLAPSMAQAAVPECTDSMSVRTSQGGIATVPSRNGSLNCYLQQRSPVVQNQATFAVQAALGQCTTGPAVSKDGYWGAETTAALKAFQRSKGLTVDGVYGAATRAALSWPTGIYSADPACQRL